MIHGTAMDGSETFQFTIEAHPSGGYALQIQYSGECHRNVTGAGLWPTIDKAKSVAQETATRLLDGAIVRWSASN
jgi:hypothetical protein